MASLWRRLTGLVRGRQTAKTGAPAADRTRRTDEPLSQTSPSLPPKAQAKRTWRVGATLDSDFRSVQDAVTGAQAGDTISIGSGTYAGSIKINKDLVLVGAGDGRASFQTRPSATPGVFVGPVIAGGDGGDGEPRTVIKASDGDGPVIWVEGGKVSISRLRVTGGKGRMLPSQGDGLRIDGEADVDLTHIVSEQNEMAGVRMRGKSKAHIEHCEFLRNASCGVVMTRGALAEIADSEIHDNQKAGMALSGGLEDRCVTETTISDCRIYDNVGSGIMLDDNPPVAFRKVRIERNAKHGLLAWNLVRFRLVGSDIVENGGNGVFLATYPPGDLVGLKYPPRIEATMRNNRIAANEGSGIAVGYESSGEQLPSWSSAPPGGALGMPSITLLLKGNGNDVPGAGAPNGNHKDALTPPYPGAPWPTGFVGPSVRTETGAGISISGAADELLEIYAAYIKEDLGGPAWKCSKAEASRIRAIGVRLNLEGGHQAMLDTFALVQRRGAERYGLRVSLRNLEMQWDGIGQWRG